jgi:uncharacterized protein (DUF433 family)
MPLFDLNSNRLVRDTVVAKRGSVTVKTFSRTFGYTEPLFKKKPGRKPRQSILDVATYGIPEAAAFLAIPRRTLYRWFVGSERVFSPAAQIGEFVFLSFKDVAQAYMLFVLREFHDISTSQIVRQLRELRKETKSAHPLLTLDIKVSGSTLLYEKPTRGNTGRQVVDLASSRNLFLGPVADVWSKRILQNDRHQPLQIFPWRHFAKDSDSRPVSMDPNVMSGRLVVAGTRIPVSALLGLHATGKKPMQIAKSYRLNIEIVEKALSHIEPTIQQVA